jgi:serine/threonine-protein kinase RsbW
MGKQHPHGSTRPKERAALELRINQGRVKNWLHHPTSSPGSKGHPQPHNQRNHDQYAHHTQNAIQYKLEIVTRSLPADLAGIPGTGLGSFLMKKSVDEIAFYNLGREGKELHLVKHLPYKSIVDYNKPSELEPFPGPTKNVAPSEKKEFRIRLMEPTEVYEVSKLFYRAYGYTYGIEIIYYPERFAQALADKSIISVVTVDSNDHIAGHAALVKDAPDSKIAEAAMAVVQPDFRGYGCQNAMISSLVEEGKRRG